MLARRDGLRSHRAAAAPNITTRFHLCQQRTDRRSLVAHLIWGKRADPLANCRRHVRAEVDRRTAGEEGAVEPWHTIGIRSWQSHQEATGVHADPLERELERQQL